MNTISEHHCLSGTIKAQAQRKKTKRSHCSEHDETYTRNISYCFKISAAHTTNNREWLFLETNLHWDHYDDIIVSALTLREFKGKNPVHSQSVYERPLQNPTIYSIIHTMQVPCNTTTIKRLATSNIYRSRWSRFVSGVSESSITTS